MSELFLKILNMSISASWLVAVVLLLRLVLKKAPKWIFVLLWGFVAVRLICPFSIESVLSLIPSVETVSPQIMMDRSPKISTGIDALNSVINPVISESFSPHPAASANPLQILIPVTVIFWIAGIVIMLIYTAVSYWLLWRRVSTAVRLHGNIFQSENVDSPFVLGIFKPKIYLPFTMDTESMDHVIAHERSHICRKDHLWKPIGFLLLTIHWFNPLMWVGYLFLCRDIELACDEKVIRVMDNQTKADYSEALVSCSVNRRRIAACPLAFGEVGVKARVKSVMHYKKPTFWIILLAAIVCIGVAVCFLTNPATSVKEQLGVFIDCQIAEHFQSEKSAGNACCVNWEVLGKKKQGSETTVYMWVLYEEYSLQESHLQQECGAHIPTAITVKRENGGYKLVEYWEPRDGSYYGEDIQAKFPWYLSGRALDSQRYIQKQKAENVQMAQEYFGMISTIGGADAPTGIYVTNNGGIISWNNEKEKLTLDDVIALSQKGYDLSWSDFSQYDYMETGSGLYIRAYRIDGSYELWIGGTDPDRDPMYIYLTLPYDENAKIDIRDGGVEEFIATHKPAVEVSGFAIANKMGVSNKNLSQLDYAISSAVLGQMDVGDVNEFLRTESHIILAKETVSGTPIEGEKEHIQQVTVYIYYLNLLFSTDGDHLEEHEGEYGEAVITFELDENGAYEVKEFLSPQYSADFSEKLLKKFGAVNETLARNEKTYATQLLDNCWSVATEYIRNKDYSPIIDRISFDLDADGTVETCTLTYGQLSGPFSFHFYAFSVDDSGAHTEYSESFVLQRWFRDLAFVIAEDGSLRIEGVISEDPKESIWFDVAVQDGHIVLHCEEEDMFFQ